MCPFAFLWGRHRGQQLRLLPAVTPTALCGAGINLALVPRFLWAKRCCQPVLSGTEVRGRCFLAQGLQVQQLPEPRRVPSGRLRVPLSRPVGAGAARAPAARSSCREPCPRGGVPARPGPAWPEGWDLGQAPREPGLAQRGWAGLWRSPAGAGQEVSCKGRKEILVNRLANEEGGAQSSRAGCCPTVPVFAKNTHLHK